METPFIHHREGAVLLKAHWTLRPSYDLRLARVLCGSISAVYFGVRVFCEYIFF